MRVSLGIDIGGTFIKGGVVLDDGKLLEFTKIKTPETRGVEETIEAVLELIKLLSKGRKINSVGIASAGCVSKDGVIIFSPNFPSWRSIPLKAILEQELGIKVIVDNDANAHAFGEHEVGHAKGIDDFILLTLGTGVGGAVFSEGRLIRGSMGIGGELGHILVGEEGPTCGCGNIGCLETYASISGLSKLMKMEGLNEATERVSELAKLYKKGEKRALTIIEQFKKYLRRALISYVHIFNPKLIILGGGLSKDFREILEGLEEEVNERVMPSFRGSFRIAFSFLYEEAGVLGIALIALKDER